MSEFQPRSFGLPKTDERVSAQMSRRPIKSTGKVVKDAVFDPTVMKVALLGSAALMTFVPATWAAVLPASLAYYAMGASQKRRLAFKLPITWGGIDYGAAKPGGRGYSNAEGILYLGNDQESGEELWMADGDARRHGFFLGTTGSGKALPLDALILTPYGWRENRDMRPGDEIIHPLGGTCRVHSVHPQGELETVRVWFSDGRFVDCCQDHLWHVKVGPKKGKAMPEGLDIPVEGRNMTAGDLGILHGMYGDDMMIEIPRAVPYDGIRPMMDELSAEHAQRAAIEGLDVLDYMPSIFGTAEARTAFLKEYLVAAGHNYTVQDYGVRIHKIAEPSAKVLKQIIWSLGGTATEFERRNKMSGKDVLIMFDGIDRIWTAAKKCKTATEGLAVADVEKLDTKVEMSCIKTDRDDGLYVTDNHIVTHNTELLLGVVSQTLMWSSGFMFVDGKGTTQFYARAWTLAKRFGREDDVRVINFTDAGGDPDAPSGGPDVQSNTLNPFSNGSNDQLYNIVSSLLGGDGKADMWKDRATNLVSTAMRTLCEMRDRGEILLNVQTLRTFLKLGEGVEPSLINGRQINSISDVPEDIWAEMRSRGGMTELYLRALNNEFSTPTLLSLQAFFESLPTWDLRKALNGKPQNDKAGEQFNYLSMQLTKPLGSLADDYGHIFRTPLGEVEMNDVVLNRRILIVLLPALQKASQETMNCGRIVVSLVKMMMGNASGSKIHGSKLKIVDAKPTTAPMPFIVVFDEAGMYMVDGMDTMLAQGRSLGFMIIVAGQDLAAMQKAGTQIAETVSANASIFAAGKVTDADKTVTFIQKLFGRAQVSVTSGYQSIEGVFGRRWVDKMDASFTEVDRVKSEELQNMSEGEFYFLFNGTLVRSSTFYIGEDYAYGFAVNKFLKVRGPLDQVPGLDQSVETEFLASMVGASRALLEIHHGKRGLDEEPIEDEIFIAKSVAEQALWKKKRKAADPQFVSEAWLMGILVQTEGERPDIPDEDFSFPLEEEDGAGKSADGLNNEWPEEMDFNYGDSNDAPPVHQRTRPRPPNMLDMLGVAEDGLFDGIEEGAIADSLNSVTQSEDPRTKQRGLLDLIVAQGAAEKRVKRNPSLNPVVERAERRAAELQEQKHETMAEFFQTLVSDAPKYSALFAEQDIDGALGLEIVRRAATAMQSLPLPTVASAGTGMLNASVADLERSIVEETTGG